MGGKKKEKKCRQALSCQMMQHPSIYYNTVKRTLLFPMAAEDDKDPNDSAFPLTWNQLNSWHSDFNIWSLLRAASAASEPKSQPTPSTAATTTPKESVLQEQQKTECPSSPTDLSPPIAVKKKEREGEPSENDTPIMVIVSRDAKEDNAAAEVVPEAGEEPKTDGEAAPSSLDATPDAAAPAPAKKKKKKKKKQEIPLHLLPKDVRAKMLKQQQSKKQAKAKAAQQRQQQQQKRASQAQQEESSVQMGDDDEPKRKYSKNICNRWRQRGYCTGGRRCEFTHPPEWKAVGRSVK